MVGLYDHLSISEKTEGIHLTIEGLPLPADPSNLVIRAAALLQKEMQLAGLPLQGTHIHLLKNIPVAAGMGGGSSDAAATLIGLNQLWSLNWSREKLADLGSLIGSDLPFFFNGPTAWVSGRGEVVEPTLQIPEGTLLLVHPDFPVSTTDIFDAYAVENENRKIELTIESPALKIHAHVRRRPELKEILRYPRNDLEKVTVSIHPELQHLKNLLQSLGGKGVLMSGSGPTIFACFKEFNVANTAAASLRKKGHRISVAPILTQSPFKAFL